MAKYRRSANSTFKVTKNKIVWVFVALLALVGLAIAFIKKIPFIEKLNTDSKSYSSENEKLAAIIAEKLGVLYPAYDPRHWSEDDEGVVEIILENSENYKKIASEYFSLTKRKLSEDLVKYIDDYSSIVHVI